jgi:hypothetical protein
MKSNKGSALVIVTIIIAILITFTFSLLLILTTFYNTENNKIYSMRSSAAAESLSDVVNEQIQDQNSTLYQYIRYNLIQDDTWPYFDPTCSGHTKDDAIRYFDLKTNENIPGFPNKIILGIYWELPDNHDNNSERDEAILPSEITNKNGIKLHIEIICETVDEMYSLENLYELNVSTYNSDEEEQLNLFRTNSSDPSLNPFNFNFEEDLEKWEWKY